MPPSKVCMLELVGIASGAFIGTLSEFLCLETAAEYLATQNVIGIVSFPPTFLGRKSTASLSLFHTFSNPMFIIGFDAPEQYVDIGSERIPRSRVRYFRCVLCPCVSAWSCRRRTRNQFLFRPRRRSTLLT